jgi:DNA modification methylase
MAQPTDLGEKKYVLPALLGEFAGKVDLIYIDPPFATGQNFSLPVSVGDAGFVKEPSMIETKAYRDTWGVSEEDRRQGVTQIDRYLRWFYETAVLFRELLAHQGSLYVHIGPNVNHLVRACLDEVFGVENFRAEIIWKRTTAHSDVGQGARHLGRVHDYLLLYTASADFVWHQPRVEHDETYTASHYALAEPGTGRRYQLDNLTGPGGAAKGNPSYEVLGVTRYWRYSREKMAQLMAEGRIVQPSAGAVPRYKRYLDEMEGAPLGTVWTDINAVNSQAREDSGYPTQKPEALLERILTMSSEEGQLVLDCFAGSGTTALVAEKLGRRWVACDLSCFAIHTTRKRLLSMAAVRPFVVAGIDAVERALWRLSTGRKSLLAIAFLGLGVATVHPVKLAKGDSVPRGLRFDPRWDDLEKKLAELRPSNPVAAKLAELLSELHEHPAIVLRNEITHTLGAIAEAPELCLLEIVELDGNQEVGRDTRFMWPNGLPVGKDIRPQTLWDYAMAQVKEALEILVRAAHQLAALLASGAAYLERPQLIYLDARTGHTLLADPR